MTIKLLPPYPYFDLILEFKMIIHLILVCSVFLAIGKLFSLIFKRLKEEHRGIILCCYGVFIIIISIFVASISWQVILFSLPIIFLFIYKIPIGDGKYLKALRYFDYFFDTYREYNIKEDFKKIIVILIIWTSLFFVVLFSIPEITFISSMLISSIIILLILKNLSLKHTNFIIESLIYIMLVPIVILANKEGIDSALSFAVTFGTIYFAIDRVFSLLEKGMSLIRENSMLYYVEEDVQEIKQCKNLLYPISYFEVEGYSEKELVRQAIFYWKFGEIENFNLLYGEYENSDFTQYALLLGALRYYIIFKDENFPEDILDRVEYLRKIFNDAEQNSQLIDFMPIRQEYVEILDYQDDDNNADLIVKLLSDESASLSSELKEIYAKNIEILNNKKKV